jgi:hypothetical protein
MTCYTAWLVVHTRRLTAITGHETFLTVAFIRSTQAHKIPLNNCGSVACSGDVYSISHLDCGLEGKS